MISSLRCLMAAALCLLATVPAVAQRTMKIAAPSANDATHEWMKAFKAAIEAREGRRIRVELFPAGRQGSISATIEAVQLATLEAAAAPTGFLAGLEPRFHVLDYPGLFIDVAHAQRTLADPDAARMLSSFAVGKGVETLVVLPLAPVMAVSLRPLRAVSDFKGLKLRVLAGTPLFVEIAQRLEASPVSMPPAEVLPALRNQNIDATLVGLNAITPAADPHGYREAAQSMTVIPGSVLSVGVLASTRFLKSLPGPVERAVREEAQKAAASTATWVMTDIASASKAWTGSGGEMIEMAPGEAERYRETVASAAKPMLAASPALKAVYDRLLTIAARRVAE